YNNLFNKLRFKCVTIEQQQQRQQYLYTHWVCFLVLFNWNLLQNMTLF
ncbi:hypothetical protein DOY81_005109, partial [Sarcophaga bullata]